MFLYFVNFFVSGMKRLCTKQELCTISERCPSQNRPFDSRIRDMIVTFKLFFVDEQT